MKIKVPLLTISLVFITNICVNNAYATTNSYGDNLSTQIAYNDRFDKRYNNGPRRPNNMHHRLPPPRGTMMIPREQILLDPVIVRPDPRKKLNMRHRQMRREHNIRNIERNYRLDPNRQYRRH